MIHKIFWTGGWDSSFRVLDLVICRGQVVQPYYVIDRERQSLQIELDTIDRIRAAVVERVGKERLREPIFLEAHRAEPSPELHAKFARLKQTRGIGDQYLWLAELVNVNGLEGIEVCVQYNESFFFLDSAMRSRSGVYGTDAVRTAFSSEECESLFNLFSFPTLHIGKAEMRTYATESGFIDILEHSWFCHLPSRSGKPCGYCNPCRLTVEKGLGYRLPLRSRVNDLIVRLLESMPWGWRFRRWTKRKLRGL